MAQNKAKLICESCESNLLCLSDRNSWVQPADVQSSWGWSSHCSREEDMGKSIDNWARPLLSMVKVNCWLQGLSLGRQLRVSGCGWGHPHTNYPLWAGVQAKTKIESRPLWKEAWNTYTRSRSRLAVTAVIMSQWDITFWPLQECPQIAPAMTVGNSSFTAICFDIRDWFHCRTKLHNSMSLMRPR